MTEIIKANDKSDFIIIENLAKEIWNEHYVPIIGKAQVDYMLDKFQSAATMMKQVAQGFRYYIILFENKQVGYLAFKLEKEALFLSKIYVLNKLRGKGLGKKAMNFVESKAIENSVFKISLTVNKNNTNSIEAYKKMGFIIKEAKIIDIGNDFVMDDYLMQLKL